MATLTVKMSDEALNRLKAEASMNQTNLSQWVRRKLGVEWDQSAELIDPAQVEDHERRISRLEEMAGL